MNDPSDVIPSVPPPPAPDAAAPVPLGSDGTPHRYGDRVHIAGDPFTAAALARMSAPGLSHTELLAIVRTVTARLAMVAFGRELPSAEHAVRTRMAEKHGDLATWRGRALDPSSPIVVIDIIRGGMIPAQTCFELLSLVLPIDRLRLDHLGMERVPGDDGHVDHVDLDTRKIGGSIEGATVVIPDPMGATGSTIVRALEHLTVEHGRPAKVLLLPLIATPEFLRTVLDIGPHVSVYAGRVDRGTSPPDVLGTALGERWDEESGLDDDDYIVPGAGGVGELLNNSWV